MTAAARSRRHAPAYSFNGPLELVRPDTPTYAYRVIEWWKSCWKRREDAIESLMEVQRKIDQAEPWLVWPENDPIGERDRFYREVLGVPLIAVGQEIERLSVAARERSQAAALATKAEDVPQRNGERNDLGNLPRLPRGERATAGNISAKQQQKLDKLARDAPHLFEAVREGRMSVNAAFVAAGFAEGTLTISRDPAKAAATIVRNLSREDAAALAREVVAALDDLEDAGNLDVPAQVAVRDGAAFG